MPFRIGVKCYLVNEMDNEHTGNEQLWWFTYNDAKEPTLPVQFFLSMDNKYRTQKVFVVKLLRLNYKNGMYGVHLILENVMIMSPLRRNF